MYICFINQIYKYLYDLSLELMNEIFYLRQNHCNLRSLHIFATDNPRNKFLLKSTVYRANQLWQTLPSEAKYRPSLQFFKNKIKTWRCDNVSAKYAPGTSAM